MDPFMSGSAPTTGESAEPTVVVKRCYFGWAYQNSPDASDLHNELRCLTICAAVFYAHVNWYFRFWEGLPRIRFGLNLRGEVGSAVYVQHE